MYNNKMSNFDHLYYNITIQPPSGDSIPAQYSVNIVSDLVKHPQNYHLAITRFTIPLSSIPFFFFEIVPGLTQTNPNLGIYVLSLTYLANTYSANVIYINYGGFTAPPPPSVNGGVQDLQSRYYYVSSISNLLSLFNIAFQDITTQLTTAYPALAPLLAPMLIYDQPNERINLIFDRKFITNNIDIYGNDPCSIFFGGFPFVYVIGSITPLDIKILLQTNPLYTNAYFPPGTTPITPPNYLILYPNWSQINQISSPHSIVFTSNQLPLRNEYSETQVSGEILLQSIIADFLITDWSGSQEDLVYVPPGVYRYIDLISTTSIRNFDIQVYWGDKYGYLRQIRLYSTSNPITMKLAFIDKSLVS